MASPLQLEARAVTPRWLYAKFGVDCAVVRAFRAVLGEARLGRATANAIAERAGFDVRTVLGRLSSEGLADTRFAEGIALSMNPARYSGRSLVTLQRAEAA